MTPKCIGIMGKVFGHCMTQFTIERTAPDINGVKIGVPGYEFAGVLNALAAYKYEIRCRRCGMQPQPLKGEPPAS